MKSRIIFGFLFAVMVGLFVACPPNQKMLESLSVVPHKTDYFVGDSVSASDIEVLASYSDGTRQVVTNYTVAPATFSEVGKVTVTVSYSENGVTKTASYEVSVEVQPAQIVEFGLWPRTIKDPAVTVEETDSNKKDVGMFTYYKGSDGNWYCKALENAHGTGTEYQYSNGSQVKEKSDNSFQWFKVEPIKWRVLTNNYNGNKLLFAEEGLYAYIAYYSYTSDRTIDEKTIYPNNYKHSKIRAWLNGLNYNKNGSENSDYLNKGFLQTAFSSEEIKKIVTVEVDNSAESTNPNSNPKTFNNGANTYACEPTQDKIFLLSVKEASNSDYGFAEWNEYGQGNARIRKPTDFALANFGWLSPTAGQGGWYFLRSPVYSNSNHALIVNDVGNWIINRDLYPESPLVVPALCIE